MSHMILHWGVPLPNASEKFMPVEMMREQDSLGSNVGLWGAGFRAVGFGWDLGFEDFHRSVGCALNSRGA